ncbi:MAG: glycosyltransferase [Bacteroidota bacterium]
MAANILSLELSVIIVNYNVKLFLEQCLCSVQKAMTGLQAEVIVVDNNSSDDSIAYLQPKFPWVQFVANKENTGFGKANNQGVAIAKGNYILFLNPDTLVPEDCFRQCLDFMKQHPDAGALGIKMVDGSGTFLPESKRAFPSPLTSFFKLTGFSAIFPKSKLFARYHLGHLSKDETHEVDVLAGAFMLLQKKAVDATGGFDEMFFMYGEDVDLSFRVQKAGLKNYYFAGSSIIHFKGESTKKGSLNYVRLFYQAMSLFVKKHYGGSKAAFFSVLIQVAILLRAMLTALAQFIRWIGLPLIDAAITLSCLIALKYFWSTYIKPGVEPVPAIINISLPAFTVLFILAGSIAGLYDKWYRPLRTLWAMLVAIVINLAAYSLLNEQYRFSRGIILFGGIAAALGIILVRWLLVRTNVISNEDENKEYRQTLIVATIPAFEETAEMMLAAGRNERILGRIAPDQSPARSIGQLQQLDTLLENIPARELIFCIDNTLSMKKTIEILQQKRSVRYKFHYYQTQSLVGSDSKETSGETMLPELAYKIGQPQYKRYKRVADIVWCLFFLISLPVHLLLVKRPGRFLGNLFKVLSGDNTWVGYNITLKSLPPIKPGIISPTAKPVHMAQGFTAESLHTIDHWYARDYEWTDDMRLIMKGYRRLGGG